MLTNTKSLKYILNDDGESYSCAGFSNTEECCENVVIAAYYNGKPVTAIKENAFSRIGADNNKCECTLKSVFIPKGVIRIEGGAFDLCYNLIKIELPESLKFIGSDAFEHCGNLREIIIPEGVETIEAAAFLGCQATIYCESARLSESCARELDNGHSIVICDCKNNLKDKDGYEYTIVNGLRYALKDDFAEITVQFSDLQCADIPKRIQYDNKEYTVTAIRDNAFSHTSLKELYIPESVEYIGNNAISGSMDLIVYCEHKTPPKNFEKSLDEFGGKIPVIWNYKINDKDADGYVYAKIDGLKYALKNGFAELVRQEMQSEELMIPMSVMYNGESYIVTTIRDQVLNYSPNLKRISIPTHVTRIGKGAIQYTKNLERIKVAFDNPIYHNKGNCLIETESKTLIKGCKNSVIPNDGSVKHIGDNAFCSCRIQSIVIPDSIESIGSSAFEGSRCKIVTVPESVDKIGAEAFSYCNIEDIFYAGTMRQWEHCVEKGVDWDSGKTGFTVHCADGDIRNVD